ncbi:MAG: glutamine--fructose-6-phosphate transaminase (isomerizing) [Sedimenticola sp.]
MCGIFAAINGSSVTSSLIKGLGALSYRGYDSAGIAVISDHGLERRRVQGKLKNLTRSLKKEPLDGSIGIAHTRWATHGAPNRRNAHPHMTRRVAVAHNGIIENYPQLRRELEADGYRFHSDTDSEVVPLLITRRLHEGDAHAIAMRNALSQLEGSFAIAAVFGDDPDSLYAARQGSPLVIGHAEDAFYLSSDVNALGDQVDEVCHLQNGDLAHIDREQLTVTDFDGRPLVRKMHQSSVSPQAEGMQGYPHYMLKEIHEQPEVIERTLAAYLDAKNSGIKLPKLPFSAVDLPRLSLVACGTSSYAGMISKYWMESIAALPVDVDIASEYRYRGAPLNSEEAALFISQSGETADTLAALRHAKAGGQDVLSLVNVTNSSMAQESDTVLPTLAGPEIGVASTKAFTGQLAVLSLLTTAFARQRGCIDKHQARSLIEALQRLPAVMRDFLAHTTAIEQLAGKLRRYENMLYLGRGVMHPLALEGALKLKEISYIHAEAFPAGELKHGPIALIDDAMPVVVIAPPGPLFAKSLSNLREVASRGGKIILISDEHGIEEAGEFIHSSIAMPDTHEMLQPILYSLPLQLLAYHIASLNGTNVDQPRNLAKSVTVE